MERHMLNVRPDHSGWVLTENDEPIDWFRTRQGAVAFGEVKAYTLFVFAGIPSALTIFMDETASVTDVEYG